ncbi:MAG: DUF1499 domain-containing protein, partial [Abitibacteriaceae bacterium]|nr:DUF1499 domain-containing protein [Abditibacteriaceae bacterium]
CGGAVLLLVPIMILGAQNPINHAATRPDHSDPLLRTRHYHHSLYEVRRTVQETISTLRTYGGHWQTVPEEGLVPLGLRDEPVERVIRVVVPVLVFKDDLTITLHGNSKETTLDVRSASRVGKGDFGENRRHILQLLQALDERLKP